MTEGLEILPSAMDSQAAMNLALLNILEDFAAERTRLHETQRAIMNILDDFGSERAYLEHIQKAVLNILDDFTEERSFFKEGQRAFLNILEDFFTERSRLETTQKAVLNILEDFDAERTKVHGINEKLRLEIDERIQIEKALLDKGQALARSNAELEQFAYIASHDLQAPLRTISSFVEILGETMETIQDETANRHFAYIVDGVTRMQDLIKALLEYSRVGREIQPFRLLSTTAICRDVLRDLSASIEDIGAVIHYEELPQVLGDYTMLRQLFQNLIGNGIKFQSDKLPIVSISARKGEHFWEFRVQDNGIGIDPGSVSRLFVIFQRLHARQKYPGTGIGLAICKKIVESHGGRIWIEFPEDKVGTVFAFTLPDSGEAPDNERLT